MSLGAGLAAELERAFDRREGDLEHLHNLAEGDASIGRIEDGLAQVD
jgi:hypothetical protein